MRNIHIILILIAALWSVLPADSPFRSVFDRTEDDPNGGRAKSRDYYRRNRLKGLAKANARNAARRRSPSTEVLRRLRYMRDSTSVSSTATAAGGRGKGKTTERGYGARHPALRRRIAREVAAGGAFCARCSLPIAPGEPWDLGHDDNDRSLDTGPEHRRCNRSSARRQRPVSRQW